MKKILIFGATGNIGIYLADYFVKHVDLSKYEVIAIGRKDTDIFSEIGIEYVNVDIRNAEDFRKIPSDDIYAIVNLTGLLPAYYKEFDPFAYTDTNIVGGLRIMEFARKNNADRVLYTQTWADQAGYWGKRTALSPSLPRKLVYKGDHAFYAITKSMMTDTMEFYKQEYGIKSFIFRLPNVYLYSPIKEYFVDGMPRKIAYRYMIDRASKGEDIEMWGNPDSFKDILYIKDLCQMMFKATFTNRNGGTYNAGTGKATTIREQIDGMIEIFSPPTKRSRVIEKPDKPTFTSFVMDVSDAEKELGYKPEYDYLNYLKDYKLEMEMKRFDRLWT